MKECQDFKFELIFFPSTKTSPEEGFNNPVKISTNVVFPEPVDPIIPIFSFF